MKNNTTVRKHSSPLLKELLSETTPVEKLQTSTKMFVASRLGDLIVAKGWGKKEFAEKVNKNPSEITKWLSGTQNFTIDTLAEIAIALDMPITDLLNSKQVQVVNKLQIMVSVKSVEPSIQYVTPFHRIKENLDKFYLSSSQFFLTPLASSLQS